MSKIIRLLAGAALAAALVGCGGSTPKAHTVTVPAYEKPNVAVCQHYLKQRAWVLHVRHLAKPTVAQLLNAATTFTTWVGLDQQNAVIGTPLYQDLGGLFYVEQNGDTGGHTVDSTSKQVLSDCAALGVKPGPAS
jgi:hypothetical protein